MLLAKVSYLKKRYDTSVFFLLKNSVYNLKFLSTIFFVIIVSTTLTTLAGAEISFTERTRDAGLTYTGPTWGAQWTDYDGDGWPDIWVTNHESKEPSLYLNMGNGTFNEISDSIWAQKPYENWDTHGAAWADFDNDGDQDVLISAGTYTQYNPFFVNDNGTLYERSAEYGLGYILNRGRMPLWLDFDNDGLLDVYINGMSKSGEGYAALFWQNDATGFFENVNTLVGFEDHNAPFSMLSDLTGDGVLDIITYNGDEPFPTYVHSTTTIPFVDHRDELFPSGTGYAADAAFADFNGDLSPDLYVVRSGGDEQAALVTPTKLAMNILSNRCGCEKGITFKANGTVTILFSVPAGSADHPFYIGSAGRSPEAFPAYIAPDDPRIWGMWPRVPVYLELNPNDSRVHGISPHRPGVDVGVYIGFDAGSNEWTIVSSQSLDERFWCKFTVETNNPITDWATLGVNMFVPNTDTLYIHDGARLVEIPSQQSGINHRVEGRSVVAGDFDNDMDIDLYVMNSKKVMNIPNILLENDGTGVFTEVANAGGAAGTLLGAGSHVVTADYNRDGFLDLFLANGMYPSPFDHLGPIQLFENAGNNNHWVEIDLVGTTSNRDGIGARVLATAGGVTQLREQDGGMHKYSQNHKRIHFGLGQNAIIQRLEVQWPSGTVQVLRNIEADKIIQVVESSSSAPQPPVAEDDSTSTDMDTATKVDVLVNDYDSNGDTLTIIAVQSQTDEGGAATINNNASPSDPSDDFIDYAPPGGFAGTDTFTYTIDDGTGFTDTATVTVAIKSSTTCGPYGDPNYDPATEDGVFLWKEGNVWHLRAVAGSSGWLKYTGSIVANMDVIRVTPVSLESNDTLNISDPQNILIGMGMVGPYYDGIDFEFPAGATALFDVQARDAQANSVNAADLVFIGGDRCLVDGLPYQLPSAANTLPVATFTADPVGGEAPLLVTFDAAMSYDPDANGSIGSYEWDYGDGTNGDGITASHTYNAPGIYNVILTVTDNVGSSDTASQTITVESSNTCNLDEEPNYNPSTEDGLFLWKEGNVWHLRAVAGSSGWLKYTGSIVSDMDVVSVTPVSLESNDTLNTSDPRNISFGMGMVRDWYDGISFEFPAGATVHFNAQARDAQANSVNAADLVFIGGDRCTIGQLPYQLP